jgi:hypothetical protein
MIDFAKVQDTLITYIVAKYFGDSETIYIHLHYLHY